MKFGKEFAAQMVPEWQDAYMDYRSLKLILKQILHCTHQRKLSSSASEKFDRKLNRRISLYRAFSGLTGRYRASLKKSEDEVILVSAAQEDGSEEGHYQTFFLMASEEGGEHELLFFRRLDEEFNKVVAFYKKKVEQVMAEADELSKQMDFLIALRIKVENPMGHLSRAEVMTPGRPAMDTIQEVEMSSEESSKGGRNEQHEEKSHDTSITDISKLNRQSHKPPKLDLEILDHVKINVAPETPVSTLKGILKSSNSHTTLGKEELRKSEEQMKRAFIEFYRRLRLLKSYSFLNQLAFSKIMKKYDKVTSRSASKTYLEMVDNSYLGSCEEVNKLIERAEATFVKHFANGNHRKGMSLLRPVKKREKHRITYFLGFFSGCSIALMVAVGVLIQVRDIFQSEGRGRYMENIFPLYSLFGYIVLHMTMYSGNVYFWKHYRVNYPFIFGFKQGTEIGYREVLLVSSGLAVLTLAGVLSNLDMEMNPKTQSFKALTELVPLGLLIFVFLIVFCPFNIVYRSSRFFLLRSAFHCLCAPLYKVTLPDFFLADQLTSQVQALRSLEFYVCYYFWGDFRKRSNKCYESEIFKTIYVIIAILPYWSRFLQCLRRLFEEKDSTHALNGLKYFLTIVAVTLRTVYDLYRAKSLFLVVTVSSIITTIFSTYWDLVMDWGLLRRNSRNPWLREKLLISNKKVYFAAMVLNILLRLAWMQTVLGIREAPLIHRKALVFLVACLEIIRRGIWNFFRLENEHLNNVGNFRAFKSVPLPFFCDDHDDQKRA